MAIDDNGLAEFVRCSQLLAGILLNIGVANVKDGTHSFATGEHLFTALMECPGITAVADQWREMILSLPGHAPVDCDDDHFVCGTFATAHEAGCVIIHELLMERLAGVRSVSDNSWTSLRANEREMFAAAEKSIGLLNGASWARLALQVEGERIRIVAGCKKRSGKDTKPFTESQLEAVRCVLQEAKNPYMTRALIKSHLESSGRVSVGNDKLTLILDHIRDKFPGEYKGQARQRKLKP